MLSPLSEELIQDLRSALALLPWLQPADQQLALEQLALFDAAYPVFSRYLSRSLCEDLAALLPRITFHTPHPPALSVVVPVYRANPLLLRQALLSLKGQIGVQIRCLISVDGRDEDRLLVEQLLQDIGTEADDRWAVEVIVDSQNRGVAICRNRALARVTTDFFTCLDADDLFHPLRCLHAVMRLAGHGVRRVNTGYARVSLQQNKAVLVNGKIAQIGHNSFVAQTSLLRDYGYLADLPRHEDTEYVQRLLHYQEPMVDLPFVGHYLHTEPSMDYQSLSTDGRREAYAVADHPYLCGTIDSAITPERAAWNRRFAELYQATPRQMLAEAFPAQPPMLSTDAQPFRF